MKNLLKRSFCHHNAKPIFPTITSSSKKTHENLLKIISKEDVEDLSKDQYSETLKADLKKSKTIWDYNSNENGSYNRTLIKILDLSDKEMKIEKKINSLLAIGADSSKQLTGKNIDSIDIKLPQDITNSELPHFLNGLILGNYKFEYKSHDVQESADQAAQDSSENESKHFKPITSVNIISDKLDMADPEVLFKIVCAQQTLIARNWANSRANIANTAFFLSEANRLSNEYDIEKFVLRGDELVEHRMNLHYAVGKGSANEPIFVNLTYNGNPKSHNVHSIVGKGITFDCGGLNIKPTGYMETMYMDKAGACAVLAAFEAVAKLKLPINLTCSMGFAENFISSNSYRPSDIIESRKGLTVEIGNTDAEGRLVLADVMSWTQQVHKPVDLIELSTLTGACMVALGEETAGLFSNNDELKNQLVEAGLQCGEKLWHLPIFDEHREAMKGKFSDLNNSGGSRYGGASQAAAFLEKFVEKDVKWAHIDIAGPADTKKGKFIYSQGCTGFGVQTILHYLKGKIEN